MRRPHRRRRVLLGLEPVGADRCHGQEGRAPSLEAPRSLALGHRCRGLHVWHQDRWLRMVLGQELLRPAGARQQPGQLGPAATPRRVEVLEPLRGHRVRHPDGRDRVVLGRERRRPGGSRHDRAEGDHPGPPPGSWRELTVGRPEHLRCPDRRHRLVLGVQRLRQRRGRHDGRPTGADAGGRRLACHHPRRRDVRDPRRRHRLVLGRRHHAPRAGPGDVGEPLEQPLDDVWRAGRGSGWCWGRNTNGQVGDGTKKDRSTPTRLAGRWSTVGSRET